MSNVTPIFKDGMRETVELTFNVEKMVWLKFLTVANGADIDPEEWFKSKVAEFVTEYFEYHRKH